MSAENRMPGASFIGELPDGAVPINSCVFNDQVHVTTDKGVYVWQGSKWHRIELVAI